MLFCCFMPFPHVWRNAAVGGCELARVSIFLTQKDDKWRGNVLKSSIFYYLDMITVIANLSTSMNTNEMTAKFAGVSRAHRECLTLLAPRVRRVNFENFPPLNSL